LDKSLGIDETNTFQLKFFIEHEIVGVTGLGGLLALEAALEAQESACQIVRSSGICTPNQIA